jgi:hypothetical protein
MASTSVVATTGNQLATASSASLPAVAGAVNQLCGFSITGGGATAASIVQATITGLIGGAAPSLILQIPVPQGVNNGISPIIVNFPNPIPASGPNVEIVLNLPSFGAGNTNAVGNIWGLSISS